MKCYRCGETSPEPSPTREALAAELANARALVVAVQAEYDNERRRADYYQGAHAKCGVGETRYEDVDEAKAEAARANEELADAEETVEQLRAELRRYEPSDGMMYKLNDMQGRIDRAAYLFESGPLTDSFIDDVKAWLTRYRTSIVPPQPLEPLKTILALHTVIDEARRLFDAIMAAPGEHNAPWDDVDAWRNKVLVQEARETVSGEVKELAVKLQQLADANARQAAELLNAHRGRQMLVEFDMLMSRKLDRIGDIVVDIIDKCDGPAVTREQLLAERICKELQVASLDYKYPAPVHIAFHFRDQKRADGLYDALPGDGFAFLGAAPKWLALQFDCGGVMGCANITYDYLRAVLEDPRSDSPVQLTERVKDR